MHGNGNREKLYPATITLSSFRKYFFVTLFFISACSGTSNVASYKAEAPASSTNNTSKNAKPTLTNIPKSTSTESMLNVTVSGDFEKYYYFVSSSNLKCPSEKDKESLTKYKLVATIKKPIVAPLAADGPHSLCVLGVDKKGKISDVTQYTWVKDTIPPIMSLTNTPADPNAQPSIEVTVSSKDATHYKAGIAEGSSCDKVTYGDWTLLATKYSATLTTDGTKTLCVVGKDVVGNENLHPAKATWLQSGKAPTATLTGAPTNESNVTTLDITVAGDDVVKYKYAVISGTATCSAATYSSEVAVATKITTDISALSDGTITVCALGINKYGTTQPASSATSASWTKNTYVPQAVLNNVPDAETNVTPLAITVSGTGVTQYKYALVTTGTCTGATYGAWTPIATLITNSLTDNNYMLCVIGKDNAGNEDPTDTTYAFEFDSAAPTVSLTGTPSAQSKVTPVVITVGGTDVLQYQYTFEDGQATLCSAVTWPGTWTAISTNISQTLSSEGAKRICIRGRDGATNVQATPTTVDWTHDITPPTATLTNPPASFHTGALNVNVGGAGVATYIYSIVASGTACTAATYSATPIVETTNITDTPTDGAKRLCVKGIDAAGNEQVTATEATWTEDSTVPVLNSFVVRDKSTDSTSISNAPTVEAVFNVTEANTASYCASTSQSTQPAVGDGCWTTTHPVELTVTNNQTVYAWVKDNAGNITAAAQTDSIPMVNPCDIGDMDAATCTINSNKGTQTNGDSTTWEGSANIVFASGAQMTTNNAESITITTTGNITVDSGVTLTANAVISAANISIVGSWDVSGKGSAGGTIGNIGSGAGAASQHCSNSGWGASYGGVSGTPNYCGAGIGSTYGSATAPVDYGSGGDSTSDNRGGHGGGKLKLTASGTLTVSGSLKANGQDSSAYSAGNLSPGAGSGGSIWLVAATMSGSGTVEAKGGAPLFANSTLGSGGGGGRIAMDIGTPFLGTVAYSGGESATLGQTTWGSKGTFNLNITNPCTTGTLAASNTCTINSAYSVPDGYTLTGSGHIVIGATGALTAIYPKDTITISATDNVTISSGGSITANISNLSATNVTITGTLSANALGERSTPAANGNGTGGGVYNGNTGGGGGYGGAGGYGNYGSGADSGTTYGSAAAPTDFGSAGGAAAGIGGAGGGKIKITASGTLTIDGTLSANGAPNIQANHGGGGSGGSLYLIANNVTGSGAAEAKGGNGVADGIMKSGAGGGGRIAIKAPSNSFTGFNVNGGTATAAATDGAVGTIFFDMNALCDSGSTTTTCTISSTKTALTAGYTYGGTGDLVIANNGLLQSAATQSISLSFANVTVQSGGAIKANLTNLTATNVTVDSGGSIHANALGYQGADNATGSETGAGISSAASWYGGGGGAHGGYGGAGHANASTWQKTTYGSITAPVTLGASGGSDGYNAYQVSGHGGGAIKITASGTLTNNGTISANGSSPTGTNDNGLAAGGGAGGSLWIVTTSIAGNGSFSAIGGNGTSFNIGGGGGGGGRIAFYTTGKFDGSFSVAGGSGHSASMNGGLGSIHFQNGDNYCATGTLAGTCTVTGKFAFTSGATLTVPGNLIVANGGLILTRPTELMTITVTGDVTVQNGGSINANLTHLTAANVTVDSGGSISANELGYQGVDTANGPGSSGGTAGGGYLGGGGGGHGGTGGRGGGAGYLGAAGGATDGSRQTPTTMGSAGGSDGYTVYYFGGHGGGAVKITVTNTLTNNGTISADGGNGISFGNTENTLAAGGGAGGSLFITTNSVSGNGNFTAKGGAGIDRVGAMGGGGGGGRIAFISSSKFAGSFNVTGGSGPQIGEDGQIGTIYFDNESNYCSTGTLATTCTISGKYILENASTFTVPGSLIIASGGQITTRPAESTTIAVTGDITIQSGGSIQANLTSLSAANVTIDSGGSINVDGLGYQGHDTANGPGTSGGTAGSGSAGGGGGAHGGKGGNGASGVLGGQSTYGTATAPAYWGSAGGSDGYADYEKGGNGGGAVKIVASTSFTLNGSISANGAAPYVRYTDNSLAAGGGAGGSIWIQTAAISGSGTLSASGATGTNRASADAGGGAGGRIAYSYSSGSFTGTKAVSGGSGPDAATDGGTGTICENGGGVYCDSTLTEGLKVWLDASVGVTYDGSNNVTAWADQSGNGNDATGVNSFGSYPAYVASESTANNKPVIHLDGSAILHKTFTAPLSQPNTIFIVAKDSGAGWRHLYDGRTSSYRNTAYHSGSTWYAHGGSDISANSVSPTSLNIITAIYNSTSSELFVNGNFLVTGAGGTLGFDGYTLGADYQGTSRITGDIAEFMVYNRELSTSERQKIEGMLAAKYSISVLPSSNQKLWLRADKDLYVTDDCTTTAASSNGDAVGCWKDQSGQNNHLTQSTGANQPALQTSGFGSKPSLLFSSSGSGDFLVKSGFSGTIQSLFTAFKSNASGTGYGTLFYQNNGFYDLAQYIYEAGDNTNAVRPNIANVSTNINPSWTTIGLNSSILSTIVDTFAMNTWVNAAWKNLVTNVAPLSWGNSIVKVGIDSGQTYDGEISEVIGYSSTLNEFDRQRVDTYLTSKYGVTPTTSPVLDSPGLKLWLKADSGITASDNAAQFTAANSEYLSVADNSNLQTGNVDFSMAAWVYFDSLPAANQVLMAKYGVGSNIEYMLRYTPSTLVLTVSHNGNSGGESGVGWSGTPEVGKWYYVVAWHDATNDQIGIQVNNGTPNTAAWSFGIMAGTAPFTIGGYGAGGYLLDGRLAKAGFWKKVLTSAERTQLYNSGKGIGYGGLDSGLKTNLISYWNLDEASGTRYDSHTNAYNLTDNNTVTQATGPGSSVSTWADQSGRALNAMQATAAYRPQWIADGGSALNNKPALRFDGTKTFLDSAMTLGTQASIIAVVTTAGTSDYRRIVANETNLHFGLLNGKVATFFGDGTNWNTVTDNGGSALTANSAYIIGSILNGTTNSPYQNGAALTSRAETMAAFNDGVRIGSYNGTVYNWDKDIAELIIYNKALTTAQRNAVECYLSAKYNITLSGVTCP